MGCEGLRRGGSEAAEGAAAWGLHAMHFSHGAATVFHHQPTRHPKIMGGFGGGHFWKLGIAAKISYHHPDERPQVAPQQWSKKGNIQGAPQRKKRLGSAAGTCWPETHPSFLSLSFSDSSPRFPLVSTKLLQNYFWDVVNCLKNMWGWVVRETLSSRERRPRNHCALFEFYALICSKGLTTYFVWHHFYFFLFFELKIWLRSSASCNDG